MNRREGFRTLIIRGRVIAKTVLVAVMAVSIGGMGLLISKSGVVDKLFDRKTAVKQGLALGNLAEEIIDYVKIEPTEVLSGYLGKNPVETAAVITEVKEELTSEITEEVAEEVKPVTKTVVSDQPLRNETGYTIDWQELFSKPLGVSEDTTVLIVHTHTTESYLPQNRSLIEAENVSSVGDALEEVLKERGVSVIHDKTVHDHPSYNGSYERCAETVRKRLAENPNIGIIIDLHRDAVSTADGGKVALMAEFENTAQVMLVVGSDEKLTNDHWRDNLRLAAELSALSGEKYPTLMRPINLRSERFNQQIGSRSLILEVGGHGNTIEEARNAARLFGEVLAEVIKGESLKI